MQWQNRIWPGLANGSSQLVGLIDDHDDYIYDDPDDIYDNHDDIYDDIYELH